MSGFRLWPDAASDVAQRTDLIVVIMLVLSGAILLLVACLLLGFAIRYRRGSKAPRGPLPEILQREVEVGWTVATALLAMVLKTSDVADVVTTLMHDKKPTPRNDREP